MLMDLNDKKHPIEKNKKLINSIEFALTGLRTVVKDERNMRSHCFSAVLVIIIGFLFRLNQQEWLWILLCIFLMLVMEIINTIFENTVDMVTNKHFHPLGKKVKDMAAGAVLLTAGFSILVGMIIFIPKIYAVIVQLINK